MNSGAVAQPPLRVRRLVRVLIADSDQSLLRVYRELLPQAIFEVMTASSGLECVARLRERVPNVLVLEPQLPWGGGDGVLATMRGMPDLAAVPVMILTSCRDRRVLDRVAPFPICDYQVKPVPPDRLALRIHGVLAQRRLTTRRAEHNRRLERLIDRRTDGRVHCLHVTTMDGRTVVHGRSSSYYVRELAIAAVLAACETAGGRCEGVLIDIDVFGS